LIKSRLAFRCKVSPLVIFFIHDQKFQWYQSTPTGDLEIYLCRNKSLTSSHHLSRILRITFPVTLYKDIARVYTETALLFLLPWNDAYYMCVLSYWISSDSRRLHDCFISKTISEIPLEINQCRYRPREKQGKAGSN